MLSAGHLLPAADEARVVRRGQIWGGNTKRMLSSPKTTFSERRVFFVSQGHFPDAKPNGKGYYTS